MKRGKEDNAEQFSIMEQMRKIIVMDDEIIAEQMACGNFCFLTICQKMFFGLGIFELPIDKEVMALLREKNCLLEARMGKTVKKSTAQVLQLVKK